MRVHLAGWSAGCSLKKTLDIVEDKKPYALESFYYADNLTPFLIKHSRFFLFDSGAFSFLNTKKQVNWDDYVDRYAAYVRQHGIRHYFELDIDNIIGYRKVLELRREMEKLTGVQPIPVWHKSRGLEDYLNTCENYPYVAIGGFAIGEIKKSEYSKVPALIKAAHDKGALVHGLGFTQVKWLPKLHFDSVDSSTWEIGANKFGTVNKFQDGKMLGIKKPENMQIVNREAIVRNNLLEWVKFQKYADTHL